MFALAATQPVIVVHPVGFDTEVIVQAEVGEPHTITINVAPVVVRVTLAVPPLSEPSMIPLVSTVGVAAAVETVIPPIGEIWPQQRPVANRSADQNFIALLAS